MFWCALINDTPNVFFSSIRVKYVRVNIVRVQGCTTQYLCVKVCNKILR